MEYWQVPICRYRFQRYIYMFGVLNYTYIWSIFNEKILYVRNFWIFSIWAIDGQRVEVGLILIVPWRVAAVRELFVCRLRLRRQIAYAVSGYPLSAVSATTSSYSISSNNISLYPIVFRLPLPIVPRFPHAAIFCHWTRPFFCHRFFRLLDSLLLPVTQQHTAQWSPPFSAVQQYTAYCVSVTFHQVFSSCFSNSFSRSSDGASRWCLRGWFYISELLAPFSKTDQTALQ